jgi:hypothetical protein
MIAGGEQLTLRAVARLANACDVFGNPAEVRHKYDILRGHCHTGQRDYDAIEKTNVIGLLLARHPAALEAKRTRLGVTSAFGGFAGTPSGAAELIGQYRDADVQLLISSAYRSDPETHELLASDVMPHSCNGPTERSTGACLAASLNEGEAGKPYAEQQQACRLGNRCRRTEPETGEHALPGVGQDIVLQRRGFRIGARSATFRSPHVGKIIDHMVSVACSTYQGFQG